MYFDTRLFAARFLSLLFSLGSGCLNPAGCLLPGAVNCLRYIRLPALLLKQHDNQRNHNSDYNNR